MGLAEVFSFLGGSSSNADLPEIFPMSIKESEFVKIDVQNIYTKILTDVIERTQNIGEEFIPLLWDNCLASESSDGLVTQLAKAMVDKDELFLVLDKATKVLRKATHEEMSKIREDYKKQAESSIGVFISFKEYRRTDMIKIYSALEFCTVASLHKSMNLSKAVQYKIFELRKSVGLTDAAEAKAQAVAIANNLKAGKDVMLDSEDIVETAKPELEAAKTSMQLFNEKRSFYLGLPCSYITGELNSGLGDTGQADAKAIERGLKSYFVSIIRPVCKALFGKDVEFKSEDFNMLSTGLELLKTMEITSEEFMSSESKLNLVNKVFGFPDGTKGGPPAPDETQPPADQKDGAMFADDQGNLFKKKGSKVEKA